MYCNLDAFYFKEAYEFEPFFNEEKEFPKPIILYPSTPGEGSTLVDRAIVIKNDKSKINANTYPPLISSHNKEAIGGFKAEWGGEDGVKFSVTGSARVRDDRGNFLEVEVSQEVSKGRLGEGEASIKAGHEKK